MNYNKGQLGQMAKQYLKGGTAINMTIFNLPRLSVDLDLDFTPNLSLEDMEKAREKITKMLVVTGII